MTAHGPIPVGLCQCGCGRPTQPAPTTSRARGWIKGQPLRFRLGHRRAGRPSPARIAVARHRIPLGPAG